MNFLIFFYFNIDIVFNLIIKTVNESSFLAYIFYPVVGTKISHVSIWKYLVHEYML